MRGFHPFNPNDWLGRHPKINAALLVACLFISAWLEGAR